MKWAAGEAASAGGGEKSAWFGGLTDAALEEIAARRARASAEWEFRIYEELAGREGIPSEGELEEIGRKIQEDLGQEGNPVRNPAAFNIGPLKMMRMATREGDGRLQVIRGKLAEEMGAKLEYAFDFSPDLLKRRWESIPEAAERRGAEEMERLRAKAVENLSREEGAERLNDLLIRIVDSVGEAGARTSRDLEASLGRSHPLLELAARGLGAQEALEAARSAGLEVPKARAFRMALARQALGGAEGSRDLAARLGVGLGEFPDAGDWVAKAAMEIWRGGWAGSGLGRERESQARAGLGWALGAGGMEAAEGGERSLRARMLDMALSDLEGGWRRWSAEDLAEMLEGDLGNWGIAGLREGEREAFAQGCGAWRERLGQAQAGGQAEEIRRDLEKLEMLARSEAPAPSRRPRRKV